MLIFAPKGIVINLSTLFTKKEKVAKRKKGLLLLLFFHYGKILIASYGINYIVEAIKSVHDIRTVRYPRYAIRTVSYTHDEHVVTR